MSSPRLRRAAVLCATLAACAAPPPDLPATGKTSVAPGFSESLVAGGLSDPTAMAVAPDGRIFVCEQGGAVRVVKNGALLPTPFITLDVVVQGESGLLGIAFDPSFASNGRVYLYSTTGSPTLHNRITRVVAAGDVAAPGSATTIFDLDTVPNPFNHHGGALHFGPDGRLYAAVGDNALGAP